MEFPILSLTMPSPDNETIDIDKIRELMKGDIDSLPPEDRCSGWLALIGVMPSNPNEWAKKKELLRESYWSQVEEMNMSDWHNKYIPTHCTSEEFGLGPEKDKIMAVIHGDLVRTMRHIMFLDPLGIPESSEPRKESDDDQIRNFSGHIRRLERVLFMFAMLNRTLGYLQGFNELMCPFYYVLLKAKTLFNNSIDFVEAISFYCFLELMNGTDINDFYTTQESPIILKKLDAFVELSRRFLPDVALRIQKLQIHPLCYCFKWFNLLFSQEFNIPDLLPIWDAMFIHYKDLTRYSFYIGLGMLYVLKPKLLSAPYAKAMEILQSPPDTISVRSMLEFADECWKKDHRR